MSSPIFSAMGGARQGGPMQIIQEFNRFRKEMEGKNPQEEINKLLQSGKINQQQLNQAQQMAPLMQSLIGGMK